MSMRNYSNYGHTVKASELTKLLPEEVRAEYELFLKEGDWERGSELLAKHLPKQYPCPELFLMCEEYESEDLEEGEVYACWNQEDLFVITPKQGMIALEGCEVTPTPSRWVTWG